MTPNDDWLKQGVLHGLLDAGDMPICLRSFIDLLTEKFAPLAAPAPT